MDSKSWSNCSSLGWRPKTLMHLRVETVGVSFGVISRSISSLRCSIGNENDKIMWKRVHKVMNSLTDDVNTKLFDFRVLIAFGIFLSSQNSFMMIAVPNLQGKFSPTFAKLQIPPNCRYFNKNCNFANLLMSVYSAKLLWEFCESSKYLYLLVDFSRSFFIFCGVFQISSDFGEIHMVFPKSNNSRFCQLR